MRTYNRAKQALENNPWVRGQYEGCAPVSSKSKPHRRYIDRGLYIVARMHNTEVFHLYPCGKIVFDSNGWSGSRTTRDFIHEVIPGYFHTIRYGNQRFYSVRTCNGWTRAYDGMALQETNGGLYLISEPEAYWSTRVNRAASKALRQKLQPVWDLAELMVLAGDLGPFYVENLTCLRKDPDYVLENKETFARALIAEDYRTYTTPDLKRVRSVFTKHTAVEEKVLGEFYVQY